METRSLLLALDERNLPVTGRFPSQRASNAELWFFFLLLLLNQASCWDAMMFMWRHDNALSAHQSRDTVVQSVLSYAERSNIILTTKGLKKRVHGIDILPCFVLLGLVFVCFDLFLFCTLLQADHRRDPWRGSVRPRIQSDACWGYPWQDGHQPDSCHQDAERWVL